MKHETARTALNTPLAASLCVLDVRVVEECKSLLILLILIRTNIYTGHQAPPSCVFDVVEEWGGLLLYTKRLPLYLRCSGGVEESTTAVHQARSPPHTLTETYLVSNK